MKIGLVGIGSMGHAHASAWRALGADVAGVLARSELNTDEFAGRFGLRTFGTYEELLDAVDIVDLCIHGGKLRAHSLTLRGQHPARAPQPISPLHCPSASPCTTLLLPPGAGKLLSHCRLPSTWLSEMAALPAVPVT